MENKINEVFKKYSKSVDTEYNVYNCLIEEDWRNIAQEIVKLFAIPAVVLRSEQLKPIDGVALGALNIAIDKSGKENPTLDNRL